MKNDVYEFAVREFRDLFGAPSDLDTETGTRFTSGVKGKVTIYHQDVAAGNGAEMAFNVESLGKRMGASEGVVRRFISELKALTGREVDLNAKHNWPRVGFAKVEDVASVKSMLLTRLSRNAAKGHATTSSDKPR